MKYILAVIINLLFFEYNYSQKPCRIINQTEYTDKMKDLEIEFGFNKTIVSQYKSQVLIALSYFPELKDKKIEFVFSKIGTTMQCRPFWTSIFSKTNRKYVVYINSNQKFEGILLQNIPFNAQVGVIGHELSHILDYEKKGIWGILKRGIDYCHHRGKRDFECEIDSLTIYQGLGWQLYDWAEFSLSNPVSSQEYKYFKGQTYLQPAIIEEKIKNYQLYMQTVSVMK